MKFLTFTLTKNVRNRHSKIAALLLSIGSKNQLKQDYISSTNTVSSTDKESNKNSLS